MGKGLFDLKKAVTGLLIVPLYSIGVASGRPDGNVLLSRSSIFTTVIIMRLFEKSRKGDYFSGITS
jgi:hypothetical protein